jgi:predicted nucleic acid-binding Zn ribbon protein
MPLYVYQVIEPDGSDGEVFEVMQRMSEPPLTAHPESGKPVRRLLAAPNAVTRYGAGNLSPDRLSKLGFTQYRKGSDGRYEKTAGPGPDQLKGKKDLGGM